MLALNPVLMEKFNYELALQRERFVRLHSLEREFALNLPPTIELPDGEECRHGNPKKWKMHDRDQEGEVYRKYIRPPPNKTVFDVKSPTSCRYSSAGLLPTDWSSGSSGNLVFRCHTVSGASSKRPASNIFGRTVKWPSGKRYHHLIAEDASPSSFSNIRGSPKSTPLSVLVPSHRCRRLSAFSNNAGTGSSLATLPTVQCATPVSSASDVNRQVSRFQVEEKPKSDPVVNSHENKPNDNTDQGNRECSTV